MPIRRQVIDDTGIYRRVSESGAESDWPDIFARKADQIGGARQLERIAIIAEAMLSGDSPTADDARDAIDSLRFIRHWISRGDALAAAVEAIQLGIIWERLRIRAFEPLVARGKRARMSSLASTRARRASTAARRSTIRRRVAELHRTETKKKTAAVQRAARELGVKPRTVWRALAKEVSTCRNGTNLAID